jgi:hypothetical protein
VLPGYLDMDKLPAPILISASAENRRVQACGADLSAKGLEYSIDIRRLECLRIHPTIRSLNNYQFQQ